MFAPREPEPLIELGLKVNSDPPAPESLQFRMAELTGPANTRACTLCGGPVGTEYYQVAGADACPACAQTRLVDQQLSGGWAEFGRAALFGLGAAVAGSIAFAIVTLVTHMQFSLLSIAIGIFVGKAVLKGSHGYKGRRYQFLAVALTYAAITTSFVPVLIAEIAKRTATAQTSTATPASRLGTVRAAAAKMGAGAFLIALFYMLGISLAFPFFMLKSASGILNVLIIGFGLLQAWRRTKPDEALIVGPYPVSQTA